MLRPMAVKNCPNCGAEIPADNRFCGSCGAKIDLGRAPAARSREDDVLRRDAGGRQGAS
jgi:uncharacterized membrane protein YvbJ